MSTEEPSSKDATVIDDDLVAALGFEPTVRSADPTGTVLVAADDFEDELDGAARNGSAADLDDELATADTDGALERSIGDDRPSDDIDPEAIDSTDTDSTDTDSSDTELDDADATLDETDEVEAEVDTVEESDESESVSAAFVVKDDAPASADEADALDDSSSDQLADDEAAVEASMLDAEDARGVEDGLVDDESSALIDLTGDDLEISDDDATELTDTVVDDDDAAAADGDVTDTFAAATFADTDLANTDTADADEGDSVDDDDLSASVFAPETPDLDLSDGTTTLDDPALDGVALHDAGLGDDDRAPIGLDLDAPVAVPAAAAAATTDEATPGRRRTILRARKSRRVVRHIDPWSVLTFSVLFHLCFFAAMLLASVLVWRAADAAGTISNAEAFIMELGDYETFEIHGDVVFRAALLIAGMLTLASSVMVVLLTVVFNLISDLIGGIRVTVLEEERVRVPAGAGKRSGRKASA